VNVACDNTHRRSHIRLVDWNGNKNAQRPDVTKTRISEKRYLTVLITTTSRFHYNFAFGVSVEL